MTDRKTFLSEMDERLYDLKKEVLKRNKDIKDVNTLIWSIDGMRKLVGNQMLKYIKTRPDTPWHDIYERTEEIWTYCNSCGWYGYINKPDRDEACPTCCAYDLSQNYVIVKIHCQECGEIHYACQGKLKCVECESKNVVVVRKMEVERTVYGKFEFDKKIKDFGFEPWPKDKEGNLIC
jgi:hypothetical protein